MNLDDCVAMRRLQVRKSRTNPTAERERGATFVEFAISAFFLFWLIIVSAQLLFAAYIGLTLQFVATRTLRTAVVGEGEATATEFAVALVDNAKQLAGQLGVTLRDSDIMICPLDQGFPCQNSPNVGEPNRPIGILLQRRFVITLLFALNLRGFAVGRNEPV